jgi:hypothetical protein
MQRLRSATDRPLRVDRPIDRQISGRRCPRIAFSGIQFALAHAAMSPGPNLIMAETAHHPGAPRVSSPEFNNTRRRLASRLLIDRARVAA